MIFIEKEEACEKSCCYGCCGSAAEEDVVGGRCSSDAVGGEIYSDLEKFVVQKSTMQKSTSNKEIYSGEIYRQWRNLQRGKRSPRLSPASSFYRATKEMPAIGVEDEAEWPQPFLLERDARTRTRSSQLCFCKKWQRKRRQ